MFYNIGPWAQCYKTFYFRNLEMYVNVFLGGPFQPGIMFASNAGAYPTEVPLRCST